MQLSPSTQLRRLAVGHLLPHCLHAVAELGVADHLQDTPQTSEALARACGAHAGALERMLRLLAVEGVFEGRDGGWAHTECSRLLRTDHPQSMRALARMLGSRIMWMAAGELGHSLRTGQVAIAQVAPEGIWSHFKERPDEARVFDAAMTAKALEDIATLLPAFDFSRYSLIADIGGGRGHILSAVLDAAPGARGVLFDLPQVVARLSPMDRIQYQGGDFFKDPLPTADAYILSNVIHDWGDSESEAILQGVRRAAPPHAEVLLLEMIMPEGPGPHPAKPLDVLMLAVTGGMERTQAQYETLLAKCGLRLDRVVATTGVMSVIVGKPVG